MKRIKLLMIALVAMLGFSSCEKHECDDHSADLVGTWTCLQADFAEALVISADGSMVSTGVAAGNYWENSKGKITVKDGRATLIFDENNKFEGHLDIIPGMAFSILEDNGQRFTFNYCKEDLSEEILGMWVCNDNPADGESQMMIETFNDNGKSVLTGFLPMEEGTEQVLNNETDYKVVGDLLFIEIPADKVGGEKPLYVVDKLIYSPNGTAMGDIMTLKSFVVEGNQVTEVALSFLRIKQTLDLPGKKYDYSKVFVTNAKGQDRDIQFLNNTFNFAKMDGSIIDKFLKSVLFGVNFPDASTFEYNCLLEGNNVSLKLPVVVDGNKITIKMSSRHASYRDVVIYAFQDVDCSQFHMYMPTSTFENFFSNMSLSILSASGQVDINNQVHVDAVYQNVADAIESINVSIVMESATKAF